MCVTINLEEKENMGDNFSFDPKNNAKVIKTEASPIKTDRC